MKFGEKGSWGYLGGVGGDKKNTIKAYHMKKFKLKIKQSVAYMLN